MPGAQSPPRANIRPAPFTHSLLQKRPVHSAKSWDLPTRRPNPSLQLLTHSNGNHRTTPGTPASHSYYHGMQVTPSERNKPRSSALSSRFISPSSPVNAARVFRDYCRGIGGDPNGAPIRIRPNWAPPRPRLRRPPSPHPHPRASPPAPTEPTAPAVLHRPMAPAISCIPSLHELDLAHQTPRHRPRRWP